MSDLIDHTPQQSRAGIIIPWFTPANRPTETRSSETTGLSHALGCEPTFVRAEQVRRVSPSHLLPAGMLERVDADLVEHHCNLLIVDGVLSPVQQRNLEKRLDIKVIDRTGLILEIFGLRARTNEGKLQVELARQLYERSRLVRTWTHLERQRGGRGFLSGPGESQLEADKRMLDRRVQRLRDDLEDVRRTRSLQRDGRSRSGIPVIALVGYTNAGKSSLFNALSGSNVLAKDMPFATLDPTIRRLNLPQIGEITLVDTVGFITDLPTHLIESFQATLEEALEADLLIHVRDRSSPDDATQKRDVLKVLDALQARSGVVLPPMIEAWNKVDLLDAGARSAMLSTVKNQDQVKSVMLSALTGDGMSALIDLLIEVLRSAAVIADLRMTASHGAARSWLYQNSDVSQELTDPETGDSLMTVSLSEAELGKFLAQFPSVPIRTRDSD